MPEADRRIVEGEDAAEPAESAAEVSSESEDDETKGLAQVASYKFSQDPVPSPEDLRLAEEVLDVDLKKGDTQPKSLAQVENKKPLLDLPEFAKNEGKSLKKNNGKQVKAKSTKAKKNEGKAKKNSSMTETKQIKKPHHQVTS